MTRRDFITRAAVGLAAAVAAPKVDQAASERFDSAHQIVKASHRTIIPVMTALGIVEVTIDPYSLCQS